MVSNSAKGRHPAVSLSAKRHPFVPRAALRPACKHCSPSDASGRFPDYGGQVFWGRASQKHAQTLSTAAADREAEHLRDQVKHGIETFRFAMGLLVQVWGFLAAANALMLAYGLNLGVVAPFVIAGFLPALMFGAYHVVLYATLPVGFSTLITERQLGPTSAPLVATYVSLRYQKLLRRFEELEIKLGSSEAAIRQLSAFRRVLHSRICFIFGAATAAQWVLAGYLLWGLDWPLFGEAAGKTPCGSACQPPAAPKP